MATTNDPIWVQSVYPAGVGVSQYGINWDDGLGRLSYFASVSANNFFLKTYTIPTSGTSYYSLSAQALAGLSSGVLDRFLPNRFYIKDSLPTFNINNYFDPTAALSLPYNLSQVLVGSNEWATSDVINASFNKINDNFEYLKFAAQGLKLDNELTLIEWCAQFVPVLSTDQAVFAWNTDIPGLTAYEGDQFNSYTSTSATGIADGIIKDIKSYRFSTVTAPDYYTYVAYSASGSIPDHIQIRTNGYYNALVLSATSLGKNIPPFTSLSAIDVLNNQLYILDNETVYRVKANFANTTNTNSIGNVIPDLPNSNFTVLNQVGGLSGNVNSTLGFSRATEIKTNNDKVYVADSNNSCVKIYNTALSWLSTVTNSALSAFSIERIEINRNNENLFALGKTFAPTTPVLTNTILVSSVFDPPGDTTMYRISWVHDGLRLKDNTTNVLSAFLLYGLITGGATYSYLTSAVLLSTSAVIPYTNPQTVTYMATSGIKYESFKVQALGNNNFDSELSNSAPTPTNYVFNSPYKVFEFNVANSLLNSFNIPNDTAFFAPFNNIQSNENINKMLIDPTGAFLYFITDNSVYKYLTDGTTLNKLTFPSKSTLGNVENLKTGFIDDRLNFFVATDKRIFKFLDLPDTLDLYNTLTVDPLFIPLSAISIERDEFVQDWVYNKSLLRLLQNHEILYKTIKFKYKVNLDSSGNLTDTLGGAGAFILTPLSSTDIVDQYSINEDNFVHSNEFVTSNIINRTLTNLYNLQQDMLTLVTPRVIKALPDPSTNSF